MRFSMLLGTGAFFLYIVNKVYLTKQFNWAFGQNYLNDVLAGVLIVAVVNVLAVFGNEKRLLLTKISRVLIFTFLCGIFWEYVAPLYLHYSVSDPLDVLAYMLGGILNWGIMLIYLRKFILKNKTV